MNLLEQCSLTGGRHNSFAMSVFFILEALSNWKWDKAYIYCINQFDRNVAVLDEKHVRQSFIYRWSDLLQQNQPVELQFEVLGINWLRTEFSSKSDIACPCDYILHWEPSIWNFPPCKTIWYFFSPIFFVLLHSECLGDSTP